MSEFDFLHGVFNITPTPFHPDGSLDEARLSTLTGYNVKQGVNGMTILGVMGETTKLTDDERDRIVALRGVVAPDPAPAGVTNEMLEDLVGKDEAKDVQVRWWDGGESCFRGNCGVRAGSVGGWGRREGKGAWEECRGRAREMQGEGRRERGGSEWWSMRVLKGVWQGG